MKDGGEMRLVAAETGRIALLAAGEIKKALLAAPGQTPDTKTARDLSAIVKDMVAISRELGGDRPRELKVSFSDETELAAR